MSASTTATVCARRGGKSHLRRVARKGIVLLGLTVAVVLVCEAALRFYYRLPLVERYFAPAGNSAGYGLAASRSYEYLHNGRRVSVTTDADGHRVVPGAPADAPHTLYVVGDSQAFGWGLTDSETVPARLQQRLGAEWRVVNLGVPGYGPHAYAEQLAKLDGGIALVLQTEANDIRDAHYPRPQAFSRCGYLVSRTWLGEETPCFMLSSYALVKLTEIRIKLASELPAPLGYNPNLRIAAGVLRYRIDNLYRSALEVGHIRALFTAIPWDAAVNSARLPNYEPVLSQPQRLVSLPDDCALGEAFLTHPRAGELFQEGDSHLSPLGADFAAERLTPFIINAAAQP